MENNSILRFVSSTSKPERLSVLVVGPYASIVILKPALLFENEMKYAGRLHLQFSESIEDIKNSPSPNLFTDFIVIVMDPKDRSCIAQVESIIAQIDPAYLCGHLCLVNYKCNLKPSEWGIQRSYLIHISEKYQLNLINGDITVPDKCAYLAGRMLYTAATVCGYKTGYSVTIDPPLNTYD